jgi:hypothetical protein
MSARGTGAWWDGGTEGGIDARRTRPIFDRRHSPDARLTTPAGGRLLLRALA